MAKYRCGDHWCTDEELEQLEKVREGKLKIADPEEKEAISVSDTDLSPVHKRFDDLAHQIEELVPKQPAEGSEEWQTERKSGLEHMLFGDCPNCIPIRDEVLSAKGKRLADVEAEAEAEVEEPELRTSPGYFPGSKWDDEKELYIEQR